MNETKLSNFPEIDIFIIISCPLNSIYDVKTFYKILVTPFEVELAFTEKEWNSYLIYDSKIICSEKLNLDDSS